MFSAGVDCMDPLPGRFTLFDFGFTLAGAAVAGRGGLRYCSSRRGF
jgi:hypothetical protein